MPKVQPFYSFICDQGQRSRTEFLSRITAPHLYFPNLPDLEDTTAFKTMRVKPGVTPPDLGLQGILAIEKGKGNAFNMMITMGRATNNDLVIPDNRVSKFHAYFRNVGEEWTITDANSTNGTSIDGEVLPPEHSRRLSSGARLELSGAIEVRFYQPADLYGFLQEARAWV